MAELEAESNKSSTNDAEKLELNKIGVSDQENNGVFEEYGTEGTDKCNTENKVGLIFQKTQ